MRRRMLVAVLGTGLAVAGGCAKTDPMKDRFSRPNYMAVTDKDLKDAPMADAPSILPQTHYAAGRLFESQGLIGKAIEQYHRAVILHHDYAEAHHRLGRTLSIAGQHDEALKALARAAELAPKNVAYRNDLGFELIYHEKWEAAESQLRQAISLSPKFSRAHINLALVLSRTGRFDEAEQAFRAVLPEPDVHYNLGLMYRGQQRYVEAAGSFRRTLELNPEFSAATVQLAQLAERIEAAAPKVEETATQTTVEQRITPQAISAIPTPPSDFAEEKAGAVESAPPPAAVAELVEEQAPPTREQKTIETFGFLDDMLQAIASDLTVSGDLRIQPAPPSREPAAVIPSQWEAAAEQPTEPSIETKAEAPVANVEEPLQEPAETLTEWYGRQVTFKQLREILENDANCAHEATELTAAGGISHGTVDMPQGIPAAESAANTRGHVQPSERTGWFRPLDIDFGLPFGTSPVGPISLTPSQTPTTLIGPPMPQTDTSQQVRTAADRIVDREPADQNWREGFAGLAAIASITQNDFRCWRELESDEWLFTAGRTFAERENVLLDSSPTGEAGKTSSGVATLGAPLPGRPD